MSPRTLRAYGPRQFPDTLGLAQWEFQRAREDGLIPAPGPDGRWPASVVTDALARLTEIREKVGDVADLGAVRASEVLAERLGVDADPDAVAELARTGRIREVGDYKGNPLYSGRDLAAFRDVDAYAAACRVGRQMDRAAAAAYLEVRPSDLEHLIRSRWLLPIRMVHSGWQRRSEHPEVPLFRAGDLDALLKHPAIDWPAVRATPRGRPSPLAQLQPPSRESRRQ